MNKLLTLFLLFLLINSCKNTTTDITTALESINTEDIGNHISVLASDEFGGRAPATEGEKKTIDYLSEHFGKLGLEPGNDGKWLQEVSMLRITAGENLELKVTGKNSNLTFRSPSEFIGGSPKTDELISLSNSEMVFVGHGVVAPENSWNNYEGTDVKGKTVVMFVNDPGFATGDTTIFEGRTMTYYGRWTYKYEEAARQGAAGVIIIHETNAAGYPWEVVQNSWTGPQFYLEDNEYLNSDLKVKGWITSDAARKLFTAAGLDYDQIIIAADKPGFKPVPMNVKASIEFSNSADHVKSNNVAALLRGDERADEYIIYTAHWDHLGINPAFEGDSILNGAVDNATGVAALLELAEAFTRLHEKQERSVLFLAVTAEEQGLLGSEHYARNPIFPLEKTAAVINMDALNIFGKTNDMTIVGLGNSELDDFAINALKKYNRYAISDPSPEKGGYFRSDHFPFARKGVPALYLSKGVDNIEHGREWALAESQKWINEKYHKPSDNYEPESWDLDGMIDDIKIIFQTGYDLSMTDEFPGWKPGFPFKNLRDEMMAKR